MTVFSDNVVEIILGADYAEWCTEYDSFSDSQIKIRNSKFGYVVTGLIEDSETLIKNNCNCNLSTVTIKDDLRKCWKLEENSLDSDSLTEQESYREHFEKTCTRNEEGDERK